MRTVMLSVAGALVAVLVGAAAWLSLSERPAGLSPDMLNIEGADIGGPFTLVNQKGEPVTSDGLIDGPTLIYFGYTWCPDVCPVDTQKAIDAVEILAGRGVEVTPVFITVDPERDTPEDLAVWADAMSPKLVALTGTPEQVDAAADAYKVFYQKVETPESAGGYAMNHTSFFYLVTPGDGVAGMWRDTATAESMADDIARVLASL